MNIFQKFEKLLGKWRGKNNLYLTWIQEMPFVSDSNALINFSAQGKFLKIEYDWIHNDKKQDGLILLGNDKNSESIKAFWIDSFHQSDKLMISEGLQDPNGSISLKGFYEVKDNPDWGWRTVIESENSNSFKIKMFNVSPEGVEDLAVEAIYEKL
jgi:Protein of unknown function (DUF1579)